MRKRLPLFEKFAIYLNGYFGVIAVVTAIIGFPIAESIFQDIDFGEIIYLNDDAAIGKGKITDVFETNISVNETDVYGYEYTFFSPEGQYSWVSYFDGYVYEKGAEVEIEYYKERPEINRIKGMTNNPGGYLLSLLGLIPLIIGSVWIILNIIRGNKKMSIINRGVLTDGDLVDKIATSTEINEEKVYKYIFKYIDSKGKEHRVTAKTHNTHKLEDELREKIIYSSDDPRKAILVDTLPWTVPDYIKENWK
ncbi:MAG: hypothetical protein N4A72_21195 [Bacteroidales bacterium]|jgi:hypothetical protein|nr:hypothetical protein [Bacteroidales bacterium]